MPTKLRLGLSLSSIKRIFAEVATDDGNRLLTQALENLTTQNGQFIVQQSETVTGGFQIGDALITQGGDLIALNQNIFQILIANHDAVADEEDVAGEVLDLLKSQAGEIIITQDNKNIALDHSVAAQDALIADVLLTQDGKLLTTQDNDNFSLQQDEDILGDLITAQNGSQLITQDGDELITEKAS